MRFINLLRYGNARGWFWRLSTRTCRRRHTHQTGDVFERWSIPCWWRSFRHGPFHASRRSRRRGRFAGNNLRLSYRLGLCHNHGRLIRSGCLPRGFVNPPEVIRGLKEFDLDVSFYSRKISRADHSANNVAPLRVRNDDGLTRREVTRKPQNRSIFEHNDGSCFFRGRFDWSRGGLFFLPGQPPNGNSNFQTDGVRPCIGVVIRIALSSSCGRARFGCVFQCGEVLDR